MEKTNLHLEVGIELYLTLDMNIKNWNVNSDLVPLSDTEDENQILPNLLEMRG
jgi:hypothetical protein